MAKTLSCREEEEVMRKGAEHGRQVHGMTDEQLSDPSTGERIRGLIREG
jgi:predicted small metal-binding protein